MQFRQKALSKLQSPEELDIPVRFARPQGWLVLVVTLLAMAGGSFWAVTGTVSSTLDAPGVLTHGKGSYLLQSPFPGQVTAVLAEEGEVLGADDPVLRVRTEQGDRAIRTVAAGRVTSLVAGIGSVVTTGADVARLERSDDPDDPLVAMLYIPGGKASSVPVGAPVDLTVQSVSSQRYGVLRGKVEAVGRVPRTRAQITAFLGDEQLGRQFAGQNNPVAVRVELDRAAGTRSGYAWSSTQGPPHKIESMTLVGAAVHLDTQHPAEWLLP